MFWFRVSDWVRVGGLLPVSFVVLACVFGGSSRLDTIGPVIVNLAAIGVLLCALWGGRFAPLRRVRVPLLFLLALTALIVGQLIPLPPSIWTALPGRHLFVDAAPMSGLVQVWRPISLAPDLTLTSLLAVLPLFAVFVSMAPLSSLAVKRLLPIYISVSVFGALLGFIQLLSGDGAFYIYSITSVGAPVGLFANRNHEALMLAITLPAVSAFVAMKRSAGRLGLALTIALIAIPLTLATGSRSGLLLLFVGAIGGWLLYTDGELIPTSTSRWRPTLGMFAAFFSVMGMIGLTVAMARAPSVQRLFSQDVSQEVRVQLFEPMLRIGWTYFPFGTGIGSFVPVFKIHEPISFLGPLYLNHAHNELLELYIETGIFGIALLVGFLGWWLRMQMRLWRRSALSTSGITLARLGGIWTFMILFLSLADYPLRTPAFAVIFALGCGWMAIWQSDCTRLRPRDESLYLDRTGG